MPPAPAFLIVGVGASAGGLKALMELFAGIPADLGAAFVVVQHLDPSHVSQLPELLAKGAALPIVDAVDGTEVQPDRIYIITPNTTLTIVGGVLRTGPRNPEPGARVVIDGFLESLARDRPGSAVAVILSGTGADGTLGLAAVKAVGGFTFAQDGSAEYPDMPRSAIAQGHVDAVQDPAGIAQELVRLVRTGLTTPRKSMAASCSSPASGGVPSLVSGAVPGPVSGAVLVPAPVAEDPAQYAVIIGLLHRATGIDFAHYRATTITRRTARRMAMISKATLRDYAAYLAVTPGEIDALARDILINVTSFYRDPEVFSALNAVVIPALVQQRAVDKPIRVWIVGCSTGQEVYSLAIEFMEQLREVTAPPRVQIFATDISDWALAKARLGCYPEGIADEIPADRLARYFTRVGPDYQINKPIRDLCVFAKHDVTADTPFSRIDLISCRNVLIYLGPVLQRHVLPTFHFALRPGGYLLLGTSENLGRASSLYATVDERNRIYQAIATTRRVTPRQTVPPRTDLLELPVQPTHPVASMAESERAADQILLGRYAPAGVLVSETLDILQYRGETSAFLQPAQGQASLNLLTMVPFGVAEALREVLAEVRQGGLPVRRPGIAHRRAGTVRDIACEVIPIRVPGNRASYLILFTETAGEHPVAPPASPPRSDTVGIAATDQRELEQLRRELASATDYVHALVELNHVQAEQLKEAQEESQSSTEEFRSTNEELQTTKEEIESTNEELVTINEELRSTNDQLGKASAGLRASGELTAAIVETMRYPLLVLSADLGVESVNQAFLDTFHVDRQETIGRLVYDLGNGQWNIPELRRLLEGILPNNAAFDDFEVTHDFGRIGRKTMLLNARRLTGDADRPRLIVLVIADITERTRIAKDLKDTSNELLRSNAELDQFAAVASHDLQEPLRLMSNYIDLLQHRYGEVFDARAQGYLTYVATGAQRMAEMVGAILAYSRLGHEGTGMAVIDSSLALAHAMENLQGKIERAHGTIVGVALPKVSANLEQLTQLFQNLLSNALKFRNAERLPMIRVSASETATEWVFAITDNGVGMAEVDHERIFELFHRAHPEQDVAGCGIGLAICKKIVEHHRGRIWVESKLDQGSVFSFTLPKQP